MNSSIEDRMAIAKQSYSKFVESDHPRDDSGRFTGSGSSGKQGDSYSSATKKADSIRDIDGDECRIVKGSNDGYFIEAFGKSYRFASIEDPDEIKKIFDDIVAAGPPPKSHPDKSSMDRKIRSLKKGQTALVSEHGGVKVFAERSGDGKKIKMFRQTKDGFEVFHESDR